MSGGHRPCVTLADHKAVVRSWRGRAARPTQPTYYRVTTAKEPGPDGALTVRSDNNGDYEYEASIADTESPQVVLEDQDECDPGPLRTVGQIQHAYRTRARREEAQGERKAVQLQRERTKRLSAGSLSLQNVPAARERVGMHPPGLTNAMAMDDDSVSPDAQRDQPATADDDDDGCMRLDAHSLVTSAPYRTDVLRALRGELSAGRDVRLLVRPLADAALADVKLAVQQLCAESLLFCARDQNVVPTVDMECREVSLELRARRSHATSTSMKSYSYSPLRT